MDFQELSALIRLDGDAFTLKQDLLGKDVEGVVKAFGGASLVIRGGPELTVDDDAQTISVTGRTDFMNVAQLSVKATFSLDDEGTAQAIVECQLIGPTRTADAWKFSKSFPKLPKVTQLPESSETQAGESDDTLAPSPLDQLRLMNTYFVVASHANERYPFPDWNDTRSLGEVPLAKGTNFVSQIEKSEVMGIFMLAPGLDPALTIYGPVTGEPSTSAIARLNSEAEELPWEAAETRGAPIPGINLQAVARSNAFELSETASFALEWFRIYSALSDTFLKENPSFKTVTAFTGKLDTSDETLQLELSAIIPPGLDEVSIIGNFQGFSLGEGLDALGTIVGPTELTSNLPDSLKSILDEIELLRTGLYVSGEFPKFTIERAAVTVGTRNEWTIWSPTPEIAVGKPAVKFEIGTPFSAPTFDATVSGTLEIEGVTFKVTASSRHDYLVETELEDSVAIPVGDLLGSFFGGAVAPGDLQINSLLMSVGLKSPHRFWSFNTLLASEPKWEIPIGITTLTVSNVALNFRQDLGGGTTTGSFSGKLEFGDLFEVSSRYTLPGELVVRAEFPELHLRDMLGVLLGGTGIELPESFDLEFRKSYIQLKKSKSDYSFVLGTEVSDFGLLAFDMSRKDGSWGYGFGMQVHAAGLGHLPAIGGVLEQFTEFVGLEQLTLVVASLDRPGFKFPSLSEFNAPSLGSKDLAPLPASANGLTKGLNLYAGFRFEEDRDQSLTALLRYLGLAELNLDVTIAISLPDPLDNSKLYLSTSGSTSGESSGTINDATTFTVRLGVGIQSRSNYFVFLEGIIDTQVLGKPAKISVGVQAQTNGLLIYGSYEGQIDFELGGVNLSLANLALLIGISYQGLPSFGFAGTLGLGPVQASMAVFANANNPTQSLLAGSVTDLSLADVANALTSGRSANFDEFLSQVAIEGTHEFQIPVGESGLALDALADHDVEQISAAFGEYGQAPWNSIPSSSGDSGGVMMSTNVDGEQWSLTVTENEIRHFQLYKRGDSISVSFAAQLYIAPQDTYLGSLRYPRGVFMTGKIVLFGWSAQMTLLIDTARGFALQATMDKLVIGNEMLFSITDNSETLQQLATANGDGAAGEWAQQVQLSWEAQQKLGLGGPIIDIATFEQPDNPVEQFRGEHFYVNGRLSMLGTEFGLYASLTKREGSWAFAFAIDASFLVMKFDVNGYFAALNDMALSGSIFVGLYDVGGFRIASGFSARLSISVSPQTVRASVSAGLMFAGAHMQIAEFGLDVNTDSLKELPAALGEKLLELLRDPAQCVTKTATALL